MESSVKSYLLSKPSIEQLVFTNECRFALHLYDNASDQELATSVDKNLLLVAA